MDYPKISIVTPNFNNDRYLETTIQSILGQRYPNLEYIIIDGGSTDRSTDIIKKYQNELTYWISEPDSGMYEAIQKGFKRSSGEVMGWINSDDVMIENSLFKIADVFNSFHDVNWITGIPTFLDERGAIFHVGSHKKWSRLRFLMNDFQWIQQESTFWRRLLWEKGGSALDTSYQLAGDLELWNRFFKYDQLFSVKCIFSAFRFHPSGMSMKHRENYFEEVRSILSENESTRAEDKRIRRIRFFNSYISKIPLINKIEHLKALYLNNYQYPPSIIHDWKLGKMKLDA